MSLTKNILSLALLLSVSIAASAQIYVATDGNDSNPGTEEAPFLTIHHAVDVVEPGQTIWIKGGTYTISERIKIPAKNTSADAMIRMWAMPGTGEVIIDGSAMHHTAMADFKMGRCIYVNHLANYWHFKGLTLCNAEDNGMKVEGSYNIIENCVFHDNNDTGLQIGMYKDFSIEETKSLPPGEPQFNPNYQFCRYNKVINCDAYNNADARTYNGTDDYGDADGFACKLFPGPGNEFHYCRAWDNSDDNWDLYMVYFPVVINGCWAYHAGYKPGTNEAVGNGNGFKLGGGGSSGGAAFSQSTGAHVVTNCVSFGNLKKGFDQNNAYEGIYVLNCTAWDNDYNYRFPTVFNYGGMYIRNCVGFNPRTLNHEFLSADKAGSQVPDTKFNSWTDLDGCDPYKEGNKVNGTKVYTKDYTSQFKSLKVEDFMAARQADGSLPDNDFAKLIDNSVFKDKGEAITNFTPKRFMTEQEASAAGMDLITADNITIPYNDDAPDFGAFESGNPTQANLSLIAGSLEQKVSRNTAIDPVTLKWGGAATDVTVTGAETFSVEKNADTKTVTISGNATADATITVATVGGENTVTYTIIITASDKTPATLTCTTNNISQTVFTNRAIEDIVFVMGGGATAFEVSQLPEGLSYVENGNTLTISGTPKAKGAYSVSAVGGLKTITLSGQINIERAYRIINGDWYHFQDQEADMPADVKESLELVMGSSSESAQQTRIDPTYADSGASFVDPLTTGALVMGRGKGGAKFKAQYGIKELYVNLFFTGSRSFVLSWKLADGTTGTKTTSSISKGTYTSWDILSNAGLDSSKDDIVEVSILNNVTSGEVRMYDMFMKVYTDGDNTDSIDEISDNITKDKTSVVKYIQNGKLVIIKGTKTYNVMGIESKNRK